MTPIDAWHAFWTAVSCLTVDDFSKIVLALVALIALFLGPWMQWQIASRQIATQATIATRQIADNISSKRQNWIDELRKDGAEFLTVVGRIQELKRPSVKRIKTEADIINDYRERLDAEIRARELGTRIVLRLNPNEAEHNRLVQLIDAMASKGYSLNRQYSEDEEKAVQEDFNAASADVVQHLQTILKHEWERVKRGDV